MCKNLLSLLIYAPHCLRGTFLPVRQLQLSSTPHKQNEVVIATMPIMCTAGHLPIEISFKDHLANTKAIVIDCRTAAEYELGHIKNAINVPLQHLSIRIDNLPCTCDDAIFVYCRTGNRSDTFATYIRSIGFTKCQSIAGGFELWGESEC